MTLRFRDRRQCCKRVRACARLAQRLIAAADYEAGTREGAVDLVVAIFHLAELKGWDVKQIIWSAEMHLEEERHGAPEHGVSCMGG